MQGHHQSPFEPAIRTSSRFSQEDREAEQQAPDQEASGQETRKGSLVATCVGAGGEKARCPICGRIRDYSLSISLEAGSRMLIGQTEIAPKNLTGGSSKKGRSQLPFPENTTNSERKGHLCDHPTKTYTKSSRIASIRLLFWQLTLSPLPHGLQPGHEAASLPSRYTHGGRSGDQAVGGVLGVGIWLWAGGGISA